MNPIARNETTTNTIKFFKNDILNPLKLIFYFLIVKLYMIIVKFET